MSLQVWLPLNGNLNNQGTSGVTVTNSNATVDSTGKIGSCYRFNKNAYLSIPGSAVTSFSTECSVSLWLKLNSFNAAYDTYFQIGIDTTPWTSYRIGLLRSNSASTLTFVISDGSTSTQNSFTTPAMSTGVWTHLTLVYKTGHCLIYVNGALHADNTTTVVPKFSDVTKIMIGGLSGSYKSDSYINDFRVYDHALSPKEVKEISKALICHYPLDGSGKCGDNIVPNTFVEERSYTYPSSGNSDKWSATTSIIPSASQYVLSFYAKSTINGDKARAHWYSPNTTTRCESSQGTVTTASDGNIDITLSTEWKKYWIIYTQSETTAVKHLIFPRLVSGNGTGTVSVKQIKLEEGTIPTPWCPNSADASYTTLGYNSTTEIDTSGFGNHGTKTKSMNVNTDTPRNNSCTIFDGTNDCILTPFNSIIKDSNYTISVWVKKSVIGTDYYQTIFGGPSGFELEARNGQTDEAKFVAWNWGKVSYAYNFNQWYHFCFVHNSSDSKLYIDGDLIGTGSSVSIPSGNYYVGAWRDTTSQNFEGSMSDFRIYATALSADDVKELYQSAASITNNGAVMCYEFNE